MTPVMPQTWIRTIERLIFTVGAQAQAELASDLLERLAALERHMVPILQRVIPPLPRLGDVARDEQRGEQEVPPRTAACHRPRPAGRPDARRLRRRSAIHTMCQAGLRSPSRIGCRFTRSVWAQEALAPACPHSHTLSLGAAGRLGWRSWSAPAAGAFVWEQSGPAATIWRVRKAPQSPHQLIGAHART
jgi:hypothetical protein